MKVCSRTDQNDAFQGWDAGTRVKPVREPFGIVSILSSTVWQLRKLVALHFHSQNPSSVFLLLRKQWRKCNRGFHLAAVRICRKPHRPRRLLSWLSGTRTLQSPDPPKKRVLSAWAWASISNLLLGPPTTRSPALSACKCS